jgi:hypothetical protein
MHDTRPAFRASVLILTLLALGGCSGDRVGFDFGGSSAAPEAAQPQPGSAPVNMAGRWLLSSPGRGQCNMTFGSAGPTSSDGTIAPEGGCPGKFYMSRKWSYDGSGIAVHDHTGKVLAQLSGEGSPFNGKATTGEPVTLSR